MQATLAKKPNSEELTELGRATVHIVHDLKNQLNGLKLYATFLRNRMERDNRPQDELETIAKLMAGVDRAARDLTAIVRYSQPPELRCQPNVNLGTLLTKAVEEKGQAVAESLSGGSLIGQFDPEALHGALRAVAEYANTAAQPDKSTILKVKRSDTADANGAEIEWHVPDSASATADLCVLKGLASMRLGLATKIIEAHGGRVERNPRFLRVWLPLTK